MVSNQGDKDLICSTLYFKVMLTTISNYYRITSTLAKGLICSVIMLLTCCKQPGSSLSKGPFLIILGVAQDAGYPQAQCERDCCLSVWNFPEKHRRATCLALVDPIENKYWLFEATPDFKSQVWEVESQWDVQLEGVFLTHAHVGHYTGLINLGREITAATGTTVFAMPRMRNFLTNNGPWDQLVELNNIKLVSIQADSTVLLTPELSVTPFLVPHRDEYSETVGYKINGKNQRVMFVPDIDKWGKWDRKLDQQLTQVDLAFIDGSFYRGGELPGRDMSTIPHPLVIESMELLKNLTAVEKHKVHFIHFNHTNPLLQAGSAATNEVENMGFGVASEGVVFPM